MELTPVIAASAAKAIMAIAVGYGAGVWFSVKAWTRRAYMERARRWPSARGKILESIQFKRPGEKGTHFRVRYEFEVGERIESDTARASGDWFWGDKQQTAFVARYVPGSEVEVFYNPRNPKENCLDHSDATGITAMWLLAAGGTVLATALVLLR